SHRHRQAGANDEVDVRDRPGRRRRGRKARGRSQFQARALPRFDRQLLRELEMPLSYRIDHARGLILTTGAGDLTDADVLAHKQALVADATVAPGMRELSDLRGVTRVLITTQGVQLMIGLDARHAPTFRNSKLAVIARDDAQFGMS